MKLSEEQYELIEAYLKNELSKTDRESFDEDIRLDVELRDEVEQQRAIRLGFQALAIEQALKKAQVHYQTISVAESSPIAQPVVRPLINWRYWVAAASLILVLGVGYFAYRQSTTQQDGTALSENFVRDPEEQSLKGFPSERIPLATRDQFLRAMADYNAGRYNTVIGQLKTLPADQVTTDYKNYLLGLSYLANKQAADAIPLLTKASKASSGTIRRKGEWFLALAFVKNGQKEKALPTLKRISLDKAHPYYATAKRVLRAIE